MSKHKDTTCVCVQVVLQICLFFLCFTFVQSLKQKSLFAIHVGHIMQIRHPLIKICLFEPCKFYMIMFSMLFLMTPLSFRSFFGGGGSWKLIHYSMSAKIVATQSSQRLDFCWQYSGSDCFSLCVVVCICSGSSHSDRPPAVRRDSQQHKSKMGQSERSIRLHGALCTAYRWRRLSWTGGNVELFRAPIMTTWNL